MVSVRSQCMSVGGKVSEKQVLCYGFPQGSELGLVLFTTYTQPLHIILKVIDFYIYAVDSQLYLAFEQHSQNSTTSASDYPGVL